MSNHNTHPLYKLYAIHTITQKLHEVLNHILLYIFHITYASITLTTIQLEIPSLRLLLVIQIILVTLSSERLFVIIHLLKYTWTSILKVFFSSIAHTDHTSLWEAICGCTNNEISHSPHNKKAFEIAPE